ncbi:MAG: hypothetical protein WKG07_25390 [Hymenobacter sp.]
MPSSVDARFTAGRHPAAAFPSAAAPSEPTAVPGGRTRFDANFDGVHRPGSGAQHDRITCRTA